MPFHKIQSINSPRTSVKWPSLSCCCKKALPFSVRSKFSATQRKVCFSTSVTLLPRCGTPGTPWTKGRFDQGRSNLTNFRKFEAFSIASGWASPLEVSKATHTMWVLRYGPTSKHVSSSSCCHTPTILGALAPKDPNWKTFGDVFTNRTCPTPGQRCVGCSQELSWYTVYLDSESILWVRQWSNGTLQSSANLKTVPHCTT